MRMNISKLLVLGISLLYSKLSAASEHQWVPKYHFAPEKGWINDPNGLSFYDGYYHAFFQHYPYAPTHDLMYWGHVRSKDMLNWEQLPIALAPSIPEDIDGIFSGSAVVDNGNLTLIYTGVSGSSAHQMQCLATSSDGVTFVKEGAIIQKDGDDRDFRDPKAWRQDDSWFVVIGSKTSDNRGQVLLYNSSDLRTWESQGVLAEADEKQGYMWECPDFFTLSNKQILVVNPQGIDPDGDNYQNLDETGYFVGNWTPGSKYQIEHNFREIDHGHDFYASQTFLAPDGRRILIAWMAMWGSLFPEDADGWAGMLTLPRELTLSSTGDLEIRPIREIKDQRKGQNLKKNFVLNSTYTDRESVFSKEISLVFVLPECTSEVFGLELGDLRSSDTGVKLYINYTESLLYLERYYPLYNIESSYRCIPIKLNESLSLDIFIDRSSIEVFVNDGQAVLSSRIYPNDDERYLSFFLDGGTMVVKNYESWDL